MKCKQIHPGTVVDKCLSCPTFIVKEEHARLQTCCPKTILAETRIKVRYEDHNNQIR